MYLVCVPVDVSLCVCAQMHLCVRSFVCVFYCMRARVCVDVCLYVIDGALSPFPQLGPAA